jgi:hypothetical protein
MYFDCFVADGARHPSNVVGMGAIESVCDAKHSGEPFDQFPPVGIKGGEPLVPGGIRQCLRVITGHEATEESIWFVEARDIEFQNQIATQLMVFPRHNP